MNVSRDWIIQQATHGYICMTRVVGMEHNTRTADCFSIGMYYGELNTLAMMAIYLGDFELVGRINVVRQAVGDLFANSSLWYSAKAARAATEGR